MSAIPEVQWLTERCDNCLRIADLKTGDRDSWLEDADYFNRIIERIAALQAQVQTLREALDILHHALDGEENGAWVRARRWLDGLDIYHGDLQEYAVLAEVARAALAAGSPATATQAL